MKTKLAALSWLAAMIFAAWGFLVPPTGHINHSVLILVAQLLVLCATFLGVQSYVDIMNRKFLKPDDGGK